MNKTIKSCMIFREEYKKHGYVMWYSNTSHRGDNSSDGYTYINVYSARGRNVFYVAYTNNTWLKNTDGYKNKELFNHICRGGKYKFITENEFIIEMI